MNGGPCSVEDCDGRAIARGWCQKHYQRWVRNGDPVVSPHPKRSINEGECIIEGCTNPQATRQRCHHHYIEYRARKHNANPDKVRCAYEGCTRAALEKGYCSGHYLLVKTTPSMEERLAPDDRAARCLYPQCDLPQYAQGLCRAHNGKRERGTLASPDIEPLGDPFTERLRLHRLISGLTLRDMGERMGVTSERVRQIEVDFRSGKWRGSASRYLQALGLDASDVTGLKPGAEPGAQPREDA